MADLSLLAIPFNGGSLAAGATRTVVVALAGALRVIELAGLKMHGNISAAEPNAMIEVCRATSVGTVTAAVVPKWVDGVQTQTPVTTAGENCTVEPAGITAVEVGGMDPAAGINEPIIEGREIRSGVAGAIAIRVTNNASVAINPRGTLWVRGG